MLFLSRRAKRQDLSHGERLLLAHKLYCKLDLEIPQSPGGALSNVSLSFLIFNDVQVITDELFLSQDSP